MRVGYDQLVEEMINESGEDAVAIRRVLNAMASTLAKLPEGASVLTPLGYFKVVKVKARPIATPSGQVGTVPEGLVVRLIPGGRLRHGLPRPMDALEVPVETDLDFPPGLNPLPDPPRSAA